MREECIYNDDGTLHSKYIYYDDGSTETIEEIDTITSLSSYPGQTFAKRIYTYIENTLNIGHKDYKASGTLIQKNPYSDIDWICMYDFDLINKIILKHYKVHIEYREIYTRKTIKTQPIKISIDGNEEII